MSRGHPFQSRYLGALGGLRQFYYSIELEGIAMSRRGEIQDLIVKYQRRSQKLEEKEATLGINTPAEILTEIEDIKIKIEGLSIELEEFAKVENSPQSITDLSHHEGQSGSGRRRDIKPYDFWQVFLAGLTETENVNVVLSAKQGYDWEQGKPTLKPGHTVLLTFNEVSAFFLLQNTLHTKKDKLKLVHGGVLDQIDKTVHIPDFPEDEALVIIGSPHANRLCERIMLSSKIPRLPFRFEMNEKGKCINVYQDETGHWFEKPIISFPSSQKDITTSSDILEEDYGIILRITNPFDASGKNKVLILAGNHGFGTESAINFVADNERISFLHEKVQSCDFEALFVASVGKNRGLKLGLRRLSILEGQVWKSINYDDRR